MKFGILGEIIEKIYLDYSCTSTFYRSRIMTIIKINEVMPVSKILVFLGNLGSHNSGSIKDRSARLVLIDFSQVFLQAYQISLKSVILSYESLVSFIWLKPKIINELCPLVYLRLSRCLYFKQIFSLIFTLIF